MQETPDGQVLEVPQDNSIPHYQKRADLEPRQERDRTDSSSRADMANAMRENLDKTTNVIQDEQQQIKAMPKCDPQGFMPSICISSTISI